MYWNSDPEKMAEMNLGSRYKTPILPIWVTCINNHWGVLFNPNKHLMKSYSAENRSILCERLIMELVTLRKIMLKVEKFY